MRRATAAGNEREPNMRLTHLALAAPLALISGSLMAGAALAQDLPIIGRPVDGALGFQPAATSTAANLQWLDGMLLWIITIITLFAIRPPPGLPTTRRWRWPGR
jgi:hypothetical protein